MYSAKYFQRVSSDQPIGSSLCLLKTSPEQRFRLEKVRTFFEYFHSVLKKHQVCSEGLWT
jgi:hypothetical protein